MAYPLVSWFETRGIAALLTMRVEDLILRERPLGRISKDEITVLEDPPGRLRVVLRDITAAEHCRGAYLSDRPITAINSDIFSR